jgi:large subunit ribosomal protein L4
MATAKPAKKVAAKKVAAKKAAKAPAKKAAAAKTAPAKTGSTASLPAEYFGIEPNVSVMHQVVTAQLAHRRSGTQSSKTRSEVRGGGTKPFSQKGTGNARQGSSRAPHMVGGGVALGPKPRKYSQRTPKKMIALALRSALSDRALDNKVVVVDKWSFDAPSTKLASALLDQLGVDGKIMVVIDRTDEIANKSFRNLTNVQVVTTIELNAYDVLCNDWLVFTQASLPKTVEVAK